MFNYSESTPAHLEDSKHISNEDSDIITLLSYTDCFVADHFDDLTQFIPLVQILEDEPSPISVWPYPFQGDWGVSLFEKWETV